MPWQSSPGATSTWAASAGKPEVTSQTWRSWTSITPGWRASARPTASESRSRGVPSSSTSPLSRSRLQAVRSISAETSSAAIASAWRKPVVRMIAPAIAAPSEA